MSWRGSERKIGSSLGQNGCQAVRKVSFGAGLELTERGRGRIRGVAEFDELELGVASGWWSILRAGSDWGRGLRAGPGARSRPLSAFGAPPLSPVCSRLPGAGWASRADRDPRVLGPAGRSPAAAPAPAPAPVPAPSWAAAPGTCGGRRSCDSSGLRGHGGQEKKRSARCVPAGGGGEGGQGPATPPLRRPRTRLLTSRSTQTPYILAWCSAPLTAASPPPPASVFANLDPSSLTHLPGLLVFNTAQHPTSCHHVAPIAFPLPRHPFASPLSHCPPRQS